MTEAKTADFEDGVLDSAETDESSESLAEQAAHANEDAVDLETLLIERDAVIVQLQAALEEAEGKALRALAEMENVRRRTEKDKIDSVKYASSKFARDLLNVADNFGRALSHVPPEAAEGTPMAAFVAGIQATSTELQNAFSRNGIVKMEIVAGDAFDANKHEIMLEIDNPSIQPSHIAQIFEDGYILHDRLLRPARVAVAKGAAKPQKIDTTA